MALIQIFNKFPEFFSGLLTLHLVRIATLAHWRSTIRYKWLCLHIGNERLRSNVHIGKLGVEAGDTRMARRPVVV